MGPFSYTSLLTAAAVGTSALAVPAVVNNPVRDLTTLKDFASTVTVDPNSTVSSWWGVDTADIIKICNLTATTCAETPEGYNAVAGINLNQAGLGEDPKLAGFMDKLLDITFFHANSNGFTGTIPDVSRLKYLYEIDLSNNLLSGKFPMTVFDAPLTFLDLRFNKFEGELPEELFTKTDMDVIFLNNNLFSGEIPKTGNISTAYITLANNELTGKIPVSMANNKGLKELLLLGNKLEGNVPEELCDLELDVLDVPDNAKLAGNWDLSARSCISLVYWSSMTLHSKRRGASPEPAMLGQAKSFWSIVAAFV